ncbi:hypothetical protein BGZ81_008466 [Podila clonocystis]|nr:hypothetical protein BGZ81_008466 [Podila clonocystis]
MISFTDFLLERRTRYDTFMDAFLDYQKHVAGLDLESMEAKYKALTQVHSNEGKQSDGEDEGDGHSTGSKGDDYDFGNYNMDDKSVIDPSSIYSDFAASQMLQASIESHLACHLARLQHKVEPAVTMVETHVNQEAQIDEEQQGDEEDMGDERSCDGSEDGEKDGGKDVVMDVQMEGEDIMNKDTQYDDIETLQENLDQNVRQKSQAQGHIELCDNGTVE